MGDPWEIQERALILQRNSFTKHLGGADRFDFYYLEIVIYFYYSGANRRVS